MHINSISFHFTLSLVNIKIQQHISLNKLIPNIILLKSFNKENNATGHFGKDNYWKWCTRLDNGKSKLNNSGKNLVQGNQFCSLQAATRMYLHNSQAFLPG